MSELELEIQNNNLHYHGYRVRWLKFKKNIWHII